MSQQRLWGCKAKKVLQDFAEKQKVGIFAANCNHGGKVYCRCCLCAESNMEHTDYIDNASQQEVNNMVGEPAGVGYMSAQPTMSLDVLWQMVHSLSLESKCWIAKQLNAEIEGTAEVTKTSERVSPSKDTWFDIPENYQLALEAKKNIGKGGKRYTHEELKERLGL